MERIDDTVAQDCLRDFFKVVQLVDLLDYKLPEGTDSILLAYINIKNMLIAVSVNIYNGPEDMFQTVLVFEKIIFKNQKTLRCMHYK